MVIHYWYKIYLYMYQNRDPLPWIDKKAPCKHFKSFLNFVQKWTKNDTWHFGFFRVESSIWHPVWILPGKSWSQLSNTPEALSKIVVEKVSNKSKNSIVQDKIQLTWSSPASTTCTSWPTSSRPRLASTTPSLSWPPSSKEKSTMTWPNASPQYKEIFRRFCFAETKKMLWRRWLVLP